MGSLNWVAILVATVVTQVVGGMWYGPVFGKLWLKVNNYTEEEMKAMNPGPLYGGAAAAAFVCCTVLAKLLDALGTMNAVDGIQTAVIVWLGFVSTVQFTAFLFSKKSKQAFFLDTGYQLVTFVAAGAILGAWH